MTPSERFWSKVVIEDDCWTWHGSRDGYGYGMFRVGPGRVRRAHRVSYEMANGPVPDGTVFLHACDNPPCVRPDHLKIGTRAENNADRDNKGRHRVLRKVPVEALDQIRAWVSYGFSRATVASWFGLSNDYVYKIAAGYPRGKRV